MKNAKQNKHLFFEDRCTIEEFLNYDYNFTQSQSSPLIHKKHLINQVYIEHPEALPFSKSTFYKYIDLGILNVRNIDLPRKVRYKVKKRL